MTEYDFDYIIIGSGFGGSVSALRLVEKGYKVCVIERGKRFSQGDFPKSNWDLRRYLWAPLLKCFGIQNMTLFRNVLVLSGSGVGGGSLVYANTLMQPSDAFFEASEWKGIRDWKSELMPLYDTARRMLGATKNPQFTFVDEVMRDLSKEMGGTFDSVPVAVYFGDKGNKDQVSVGTPMAGDRLGRSPNSEVPDPYFNGEGPARRPCHFCGGCMVGCRHNAKNTLDKNYLYLAEKKGAKIIPETQVQVIRSLSVQDRNVDSGFEVVTFRTDSLMNYVPVLDFLSKKEVLRSKNVIVAGGVLGTLKLLFESKRLGGLPKLSDRLGRNVRTNSEAITGVTELHQTSTGKRDYSRGVAITSIIKVDEHTSIEPVRYPRGSDFMRLLSAPMVPASVQSWIQPFYFLFQIFIRPVEVIGLLFKRGWAQSTVILLTMQDVDNRMRMRPGLLYRILGLKGEREEGQEKIPIKIPIADDITRRFAKKVSGIPQSAINESLFSLATTAHILGGCAIGRNIDEGVIDHQHIAFGYPGLMICDGSTIPANLGVNPSLTITAMTERAMSFVPSKS